MDLEGKILLRAVVIATCSLWKTPRENPRHLLLWMKVPNRMNARHIKERHFHKRKSILWIILFRFRPSAQNVSIRVSQRQRRETPSVQRHSQSQFLWDSLPVGYSEAAKSNVKLVLMIAEKLITDASTARALLQLRNLWWKRRRVFRENPTLLHQNTAAPVLLIHRASSNQIKKKLNKVRRVIHSLILGTLSSTMLLRMNKNSHKYLKKRKRKRQIDRRWLHRLQQVIDPAF